MEFALAMVPALAWGFQSIVMQKIGGKFTNKVMGMVIATTLIALVVFIVRPPVITRELILGSLLSGCLWGVGQILTVRAFDLVGISTAMPISTGQQLVGTTLFGVLYFGEWSTQFQYIIGFTALILIIIGVYLTAIKDKKSDQGSNVKLGVILLTISSLCFIGYSISPRIFDLNGWDVLLPQAIGMLVTATILVLFQKGNDMMGKKTWQNLLTGLCFGIANVGILFSNRINGLAIGFTFSQLNVIIATLGGIWILHEVRSRRELRLTMTGLALVVVGAVFIGMTK